MDHVDLFCDFETYCDIDVRQVGAHCYSEHPSCEVLILCYRTRDDQKNFWLPHRDGLELPRKLLRYVEDDKVLFHAHNCEFEMCIWENVLVARHGAPRIPPSRWRCTAAKAAAAGMPRALGNLGPALRLRTTKDKEGTRLINIFCKPRKPTKNLPATRTYPDDKPEEFASFVNYCGTDVDTEAEADAVLPDLSPYEWRVFRHTLRMNKRGLPMDMDAVHAGYKILQVLEKRIVARVESLTGGIRPTQRDKMLEFFNTLGLEMENMQAKTIKDLVALRGHELDPKTRELLLLRIEGGKASTKKLKKIIQVVCIDGRVRGAFLYWGASTGRLAGRLIQPQNFTRGEYKPAQLDALFKLILLEDPDAIEIVHEWPIDALAQGMRGYIKAPPGQKFVVVDFAAIEARVVVWLAREMWAIQAYHENADMYKRLAVKLYHLQNEDQVETWQRKFAKDIWLGCLGADTRVLTRRGWVTIVDVHASDELWDGAEWVGTKGVTYSGHKEVIDLCGITVTPEHRVLCGRQWVEAASVTKSTNALHLALDTATLPSAPFGCLTSVSSRRTASACQGMPPDPTPWNLTGETTTGTTPPRIAGSLLSRKTSETADVYDLLECGPRNRFTVMSSMGPIIVHNSGFQLGWAGFITNCLKRGIVVTEEEAKKGIGTYRDENPMVVKLWADVEESAIRAVLTKATEDKPVTLRNLAFFVKDLWLCIRLPSGRLLRYPYPEVQNTMRYRKMVKKLTFRSEIKGKWVREGTYGGKLVENIVQAIARDLMVGACFNAESKGYQIVGTVHDELISLVPKEFGSVHELEEIMRKKPRWATDCPVNAEGWSGERYRK